MIYRDQNKPFLSDEYEMKRVKIVQELEVMGVAVGVERIVDY